MAKVNWLTETESRAWRGYLRMRTLLDAQIARDLLADSGLSSPDYEVLTNLSEAPGRSQRVTDLAARMLWSSSRLSHHLDRMQQRDLVGRGTSTADGRTSIVSLTDEGMRVLVAAAPLHLASVRRHFVDLIGDKQHLAFAKAAETVVAALSTSIDGH